MANPKRVRALLEMSDEDLTGAKLLLGSVTRLARGPWRAGILMRSL
jgi:hypothetical protein